MLFGVADQIATRYGALGRELSHAVLQTIALTARDGVNALDEVRRRLGLMSKPDEFSHLEPPNRRWQELLGNLFPTAILVVDSMGSPSLELIDLPGTETEERTIRKLLTAAASFLLAESTALEEGVEFWEAVAGSAEDEFDEMQTLLERASSASCALLDHAEAGSWRTLLAMHAPTHVVKQVAAESSLAVLDGQHRTCPFVIGVVGLSHRGKSEALWRALQGAADQAASEGREAEVIVQSREQLDLLAAWGRDHGLRGSKGPKLRYVPPTPHHASGAAGSAAGYDLLAALHDAVTTHQPDYLIVLCSGLPTTGPLDFRNKHDPKPKARDLGICGLPDLRGRTVVFTGFTSERSRTYWRAVCEAAGATTFSVAMEPTEYRYALKELYDTHPKPSLITTALTYVICDWGSTFRAVLVVTALAISTVVTILVLEFANLNGYVWLAALGVIALNLGVKLAKQMVPKPRATEQETPMMLSDLHR
jgi:hypothetical protein